MSLEKPEQTKSGLFFEKFNTKKDGKSIDLYVLTNKSGCEVAITNYGARIVSLLVHDRNNNLTDVVLGHNSTEEYSHSEEAYFGAICGRTANRIANGKFTLEGKEYTLAVNNGPNSLHGGIKGFNAVVWDAVPKDRQTLELSYLSKDGEEGYPGNLSVKVTYKLTNNNALEIHFEATTDKTTILNLTNHSFFNLSGAGDPYIGDHILQIFADKYLPSDETSIPYGKAEPVKNTPMDFTTPYEIGSRINDKFQQLEFANGYDHTYVLDKERKDDPAVICSSPKTGIELKVYTTEPGIQLYTNNWMSGNFIAKNGKKYPARSAVCFEAQHFPDSINHPDFPTTILRPNEKFTSKTIFKFDINK
ncbi:MAG: aldose epimerase family protein [Dysgonomonas sp.]